MVGKPEFIIDFLDRHCLECHEADLGEGDLTLHDLPNDFTTASTVDIWQNVLERLEIREMPPKKEVQPSEANLQQVTHKTNLAASMSTFRNPFSKAH